MTRPRRVILTIDRLVLRGFAPEQRDGIAAALQAELQRQLGDPAAAGDFGGGRSLAFLRAEPLTLAPAATPSDIGTLGAQRLVGSMRP
jgi:hypothetical protein